MYNKSKVILAERLWTESGTKEELKQRIGIYMNKNYPGYVVVEIGKYYAICETRG